MTLATPSTNKLLLNEESKMQLLKDVFFKGATNDEFMLFAHACERTGLDPFMRQIYPVKRWDSTLKRETMTVQTGIDGYRLIAERTGCYAPGREPTFTYNKDGKVLSATAYVKKLTKDGTWHEISASAFFDEYCQRTKEGKPTSMWEKMPHSQLAKCAEALALRKAFPTELSGLYTKEEMEQAEVSVEAKKIEALPTISSSQAQELKEILDACAPDYKHQVMTTLKKSTMNIDSLEDLPINLYERIKSAAVKKRDEYYQQCMNDHEEEYVEEMHV